MPQKTYFAIFSAFPTEIGRIRGRVAVLSDWTAGEDALRRALRTLVIEDNDPPGGLGNCGHKAFLEVTVKGPKMAIFTLFKHHKTAIFRQIFGIFH